MSDPARKTGCGEDRLEFRLGDTIESALSRAGITSERVRDWLGDCGCEQRKARLNALGAWAGQYLIEKAERLGGMVNYLYKIIGVADESE